MSADSKNDDPEVSVVMGVYNGAVDLPRSIESMLAQTGVQLELIVVDDGSTDDSYSILQRYAALDPRLRPFRQENQGLTAALIAGCAQARGDLIARQDCGDDSEPSRLVQQVELLSQYPTVGFVSCWTQYEGPQGEPLYVHTGNVCDAIPRRIIDLSEPWGMKGGPSSHPSVMFRRRAYHECGGYRREFRFAQDMDLWLRLGQHSEFAMVPKLLQHVRVSSGCISFERRDEQVRFANFALEALKSRLNGADEGPACAAALALSEAPRKSDRKRKVASGNYFVGEALRRNNDPRARKYLMDAWHENVFNPSPLLRLLQSYVNHRRVE